jgi:hypothetical protein
VGRLASREEIVWEIGGGECSVCVELEGEVNQCSVGVWPVGVGVGALAWVSEAAPRARAWVSGSGR